MATLPNFPSQFRFPYEIVDVRDQIRRRLQSSDLPSHEDWDEMVNLEMERDRYLEDWLTSGIPATSLPFKVVAQDGTGDYTSIKTAIEAVPPSTGGTGPTMIVVKASTTAYSDTGAGLVTPQNGAECVVFSEITRTFKPGFGASAATFFDINHQQWNCDGLNTPTSGSTYLGLSGISIVCPNYVIPAINANAKLILEFTNCTITGSRLHDGVGSYDNSVFTYTDCHIAAPVFLSANGTPILSFTRCSIVQLSNPPPFNSINVNVNSAPGTGQGFNYYFWGISFRDCVIEEIGSIVFLTPLSENGAASLLFDGCEFVANVAGDPAAFQFQGCNVSIRNCLGLGTIGYFVTFLNSAGGNLRGDFINNRSPSCSLTISGNDNALSLPVAGQVSGVYNNLTLNTNGKNNDPCGGVQASVQLTNGGVLDCMGNGNVVDLTFISTSSSSTSGTVKCEGNNNIIWVSADSLTITDTGSNNHINDFGSAAYNPPGQLSPGLAIMESGPHTVTSAPGQTSGPGGTSISQDPLYWSIVGP